MPGQFRCQSLTTSSAFLVLAISLHTQFFRSVGKDLASEIADTPNPLLSGDYTINFQEKRFEFRAIQDQELRDAVGKLKKLKKFW